MAPGGSSLYRQRVQEDRITPLAQATVWLRDAYFGVVYRRGSAAMIAGTIENPQDRDFVSGIGIISGWICDAVRVDVAIGEQLLRAGYGTEREDTGSVFGDADNGFSLLINWSLLGAGEHLVRVLADGIEVARVTVSVATLGTEFLRGAEAAYELLDFPRNGTSTLITWQESVQNFVIFAGSPDGSGTTGGSKWLLENPQPASFHSGLGVISGWVCAATRVDVEIDGRVLRAAHGIGRADTRPVCGDTNNGFALLINWNLLGTGTHRLRALADGIEFANVAFVVTTLGTEFLRGVDAAYDLLDFPSPGQQVTILWVQSLQNFVIVEGP